MALVIGEPVFAWRPDMLRQVNCLYDPAKDILPEITEKQTIERSMQ